ncbi:uncharacterized protein TRIREDRAFT_107913 [Trichoderma reesei QM6a]|uniref:Predicted protein n=1 Tax=Hypocrea jecorina (strain QM6a) TaxID=431241 RepID=G0RKU8_HYPJQ|nr:uncharacterized protein TRIREDRAFT_107913 [Trichoderma reesei QM6a]EGR48460.1 predicted protein [Trichoderma reesei QM6a]
MAPRALLASRKVLDMNTPELGVLYAINPVTGGLVSPWGTVPFDDGDDDDSPKAEGYIVAGTIVAACLAVCLFVGALVAVFCCLRRRRRIRREAVRNRPPTPIARGRASSDDEETAEPPIPLATLPAAKIAGKRPPANTAAHRPGFFSGMEVARPLQVPFLDTVVEATSSEERVSQGGGEGSGEEADAAAPSRSHGSSRCLSACVTLLVCAGVCPVATMLREAVVHVTAFHLSERRCRLVGGLSRSPVRRNDGPGADDPKLSGRQPRVEGCEMRLMYAEMHVGSGRVPTY